MTNHDKELAELRALSQTQERFSVENGQTLGRIAGLNQVAECVMFGSYYDIEDMIWEQKIAYYELKTPYSLAREKAAHDVMLEVLVKLNYEWDTRYGIWIQGMDWSDRELYHEDIALGTWQEDVDTGYHAVVLLFQWDKLEPIREYDFEKERK